MENRTVEIDLQHLDKRLAARLTVRYPPPPEVSYAGQQWHRTGGFHPGEPFVYQPERAFARPATREQRIPPLAIAASRQRRSPGSPDASRAERPVSICTHGPDVSEAPGLVPAK